MTLKNESSRKILLEKNIDYVIICCIYCVIRKNEEILIKKEKKKKLELELAKNDGNLDLDLNDNLDLVNKINYTSKIKLNTIINR
jgi:hypothetical protein